MICIPGCRKEAGNDSQNNKNCAITEHLAVPCTKEGACISQMIYAGTSPAFYDGNIGKSVNVKPLKLGC